MIRGVLVLGCLVLVALSLLGMRRGWRSRMARQSVLPELPVLPADLGSELLRADGLYVGTTYASSWQDRVVHARLGERAAAGAVLYQAGLVLDREGSAPIFLPRESWVEARLVPGLAGKVMGDGGLLAVRWQLGRVQLDTGFRADDKTTYPALVAAINERVHIG
jgi:hypothetical protein